MKSCFYLPVILILLLCTACPKEDTENCHYSITIINDSNFDIYFCASPDTFATAYSPSAMVGNAVFWKVNSHDSKKDYERSCIEYKFTKGTSFHNGTYGLLDSLRVYIFDALVLEKELKYKTLKRYDLTLEDLRKLDWTVVYPPTEAMKDIIQYPPYSDSD